MGFSEEPIISGKLPVKKEIEKNDSVTERSYESYITALYY